MPRIRGAYLLYMPPGNLEAMAHYRDTIENRIPLERVERLLSAESIRRLKAIFDGRPMAVWGSRDGRGNRSRFEKMEVGDDLLIVEGPQVKFMGKVALKLVSPEISRELWRNIQAADGPGWDLVYFIANPMEIDVPFVEFCRLFGYQENLQLRGFTSVSEDRLEAFYDRYDDLYSVLVRIRQGMPVFKKPELPMPQAPHGHDLNRAGNARAFSISSRNEQNHRRVRCNSGGSDRWPRPGGDALRGRADRYGERESRGEVQHLRHPPETGSAAEAQISRGQSAA